MIIETDSLTTGYDGKIIIENETVCIEPEKINILIGPNGCGKSTLFKSFCRQLFPMKGKALLNKIDVKEISGKEFARNVAILFQENQLPHEITAKDLISYGRFAHSSILASLTKKDEEKIEEAMKLTNTKRFENTDVSSLSSGQRQLVWIAMLIAQESNILFLDEPTTYLDLKNQLEILDCLYMLNKKLKKTIVMILHDINLALQYADVVFLMKSGKIVSKTSPEELIKTKILSEVFEVDLRMDCVDGKCTCIPISNNK